MSTPAGAILQALLTVTLANPVNAYDTDAGSYVARYSLRDIQSHHLASSFSCPSVPEEPAEEKEVEDMLMSELETPCIELETQFQGKPEISANFDPFTFEIFNASSTFVALETLCPCPEGQFVEACMGMAENIDMVKKLQRLVNEAATERPATVPTLEDVLVLQLQLYGSATCIITLHDDSSIPSGFFAHMVLTNVILSPEQTAGRDISSGCNSAHYRFSARPSRTCRTRSIRSGGGSTLGSRSSTSNRHRDGQGTSRHIEASGSLVHPSNGYVLHGLADDADVDALRV